jgi:PAS domain S-box-containing protein
MKELPDTPTVTRNSTQQRSIPIADTNITDQAELAFHGLLEATADAMLVVNSEGRITLANSQSQQMFGYTREQLLGESIEMVVPLIAHSSHADHGDQVSTEPQRRRIGTGLELMARHRDGTEFPVEVGLSPVYAPSSTFVIAAIRDITERRRLEEIRREVADRRAAEEALARHAQELAHSNAELEQFASVVSHDLQEPLRMIASYVGLIAKRYRGRLDDDADEFIGYVVDGAARMHQLISDLLSYSRVGTRGKPFGPVNCDELLTRVLSDLSVSVAQTGAVVTRETLPTVSGDELQLGQVFQNLLSNALKFHGATVPHVHLSAHRIGCEWQFAVRDDGIGIAPEYAERIFLTFHRLHTTAEYAGTGIGLAIAKKIVERHGGRIWVDSHPGAGATFLFTVPVSPGTREEGE